MSELSIEQQIALFLAEHRTASLSTVDEHGHPHAANVQFVSDENWRLFWVSNEKSAHATHVIHRPHMAVTIYDHDDRPENIHGLQLQGRCEKISAEDLRNAALKIYCAKFPFVAQEPFATAIAKQDFYCFTPRWFRWIDNRRGFGFKVERAIG